ncbi:unnamed protein product [Oikopleura dioica]|uniref:DNA sliding clamp PCNA n=1 Tax=Oikopleura dioica TaxID=34765 RepID=E4X8M5_OIKDI|nr:unnamed protein product [Oikopleura dioica]
MFECRLRKAEILKKIMEAIKDLIREGVWDVSGNSLSLQSMDTSHVTLVQVALMSDGFEMFRCDKNLALGVNIDTMQKLLKCSANDDTLDIKAEDDGDVMDIVFTGQNGKVAEFEMNLMDLEIEQLGIPDQEYSCVVKMPSYEFQRICRDLSNVGEYVNITVVKSGVEFGVKGDMGDAKINLTESSSADNEKVTVTIMVNEPVNLTFTLSYLTFFTKATPLSDQVCLSISPDVPMVVSYEIEDLGFVKYYLAPKIEEDD